MNDSPLEKLHQLRTELKATLDPAAHLEIFMQWCITSVGIRFASVFERTEEGSYLCAAASIGMEELRGRTLPGESDLWNWLLERGIPIPNGQRYNLRLGGGLRPQGLLAAVSGRRGKRFEEERLLLEQGALALAFHRMDGRNRFISVSDDRYRVLFENAPIGIGVADAEGNLLAFNDAILKPGGYSRKDIQRLGNVAALYYDPNERERVLALFRKQGYVHQYPARFKRKDGSPYDTLLTLTPVRFEGQNCIQALVEDVSEHKRAERALHLAETRYRILVEKMPTVMYLDRADREGSNLYINPRVGELLGYFPSDFEKNANLWQELILPEDFDRAMTSIEETLEQGHAIAEYRMVARDGRVIWARDTSLLVKDEAGNPEYVLGFIEDITRQKQAAEEVAKSERRFRALIENGLDFISLLDAHGNLLWESPSTTSMLGFSYNEFLGRNIFDLVHRDDRERTRRQFLKLVKSPGGRANASFRLRHADGTWRWVEAVATNSLDDPAIEAIVINYRDITERKRTEESLRESEEKYRAFIEQLPAIVYVDKLDGRGTTIFISPQVERVLGISAEEWVGSDLDAWARLIHPEDRDAALRAYQGLREEGQEYDVECRIIRPDGRQVWVQDRGKVLRQNSGELYLHGVMVDITERKLHERDLEAEAMLAKALGETLELQPLLERLLDAARHAIPSADKGSVSLVEPNGDLCIHALSGYADPRLLGFRFTHNTGYMARVADERASRIFTDLWTHDDIRYDGEIEEARNIHSAVAAPLMIQDRVIGVIALDSTKKAAFKEADLRLLSRFATSAALIVERSRLFIETRRRAQETQALLETSLALNTLDMSSLLRTVGERAKSLFAADGCRIFLLEPDGETLRCVLALQESTEAFHDLTIKLGEGITGTVAATGQAEIVNAMQDDPRAIQVPGTPEEEEAIIFAPLTERGRTLGVISVRRVGADRPFEDNDLELLKAFASLAAIAVSNARLFDDTQKRLAELSVLHQSSQSLLVAGFDAEATYAGVHDAVRQVIPTDAFVIVLVDRSGGDYHAVYRYDRETLYPPVRIPYGAGLSGQVITGGRTLLVEDYHSRQDIQALHFGHPEHVRSILAIPLRLGERTLGMISAQSYQPNVYNDSHRAVLETIAAQFASSIETARLFEETQRRLSELEILQSVSGALRQAHSVEEMLPIFISHAARAVGARVGSIYLWRESDAAWVSQGWISAEGDWVYRSDELRHPAGEGVTGWVGERGEIYITEDWRDDPVTVAFPGEKQQLANMISGISLPFHAERQVIGVMHIWYQERHVFIESEKSLLTAIADMAGNALQRARLHEETKRQLKRLTVLRDIDRFIASSFDQKAMLDFLLRHTLEQLKVDAASILLYNPVSQSLEHAAGLGFHTRLQLGLSLNLGESLAGRAAALRQVIAVPDLEAEKGLISKPELLEGEDFQSYYAHPLVTKGEIQGVLEVFRRTPFKAEQDWLDFFETLAGQIAIAIDNAHLVENLERSNVELTQAYDKTIEGWSKALDLRDRETEGHTRRVTDLTLKLAQCFGLSSAEIDQIRRGALLHDIGKIGIPDRILLKPGSLTEEEWLIMRQHPQFAYDMLAAVEYLKPALDIPYCHHEKWDGTGYPRGLKGGEIPLSARIFAVADVWDALTSHRPYRPAWREEQALEYIRSQAGKHFDPQVVDAFFKIMQKQ